MTPSAARCLSTGWVNLLRGFTSYTWERYTPASTPPNLTTDIKLWFPAWPLSSSSIHFKTALLLLCGLVATLSFTNTVSTALSSVHTTMDHNIVQMYAISETLFDHILCSYFQLLSWPPENWRTTLSVSLPTTSKVLSLTPRYLHSSSSGSIQRLIAVYFPHVESLALSNTETDNLCGRR